MFSPDVYDEESNYKRAQMKNETKLVATQAGESRSSKWIKWRIKITCTGTAKT